MSCLNLFISECTDGDVQLVGGTVEGEGRIEICVGRRWGTVCDDQFGVRDAGVVCKQLGYGDQSKRNIFDLWLL